MSTGQEPGQEPGQEQGAGLQSADRQSPSRGGPAVEECVRVPTAAQMRDLGVRLAGLLRAGDLVVLSGQLGAGKTTLTQGIGSGLGVRGPVTSPTFVIARVHPSLRGGPDLVHADAYRLGSRAEVDDLDLDTDVDSSVTVVEWGEGLVEDLTSSFLEIAIVPAPAGPGQPAAGADKAGGPGEPSGAGDPDGAGEAGDPDGAGEAGEPDEAGDADEARTVRVIGWGDRWLQAAQAAHQALAGVSVGP